MALTLFRTAWGLVGPGLRWDDMAEFVRDAAKAGYDGVEFAVPSLAALEGGEAAQLGALAEALDETGMAVMPLISTRPPRPEDYGDAGLHMASFRAQLDAIAPLKAPRAVVQGGADSLAAEAARDWFAEAMEAAGERGVEPLFETRRGRPLGDPWRAAALLEALPGLRLCADFSHWMAVIERWPADLSGLFELAARRSAHVHARVGHENGPQIPDPRDPAWDAHVALHRGWWEATARAAGGALSATPEFGPPPYMPTVPFTGKPVADLLQANAWMVDRLRAWFGETDAPAPARSGPGSEDQARPAPH